MRKERLPISVDFCVYAFKCARVKIIGVNIKIGYFEIDTLGID